MSEQVEFIWYENPTRPTTEEREPVYAKQSGDTPGHRAQQPAADQAVKSKPEEVDWIWYENLTRPATEEREPANAKQSGDTPGHQAQQPAADQAVKSEPEKVAASG